MDSSEITPKPPSTLAGLLPRLLAWLPWLAAVLIAVQLTRWGGLPRSDLPAFWVGVGTMIAVAVALALVGQRLLSRGAAAAGRAVASAELNRTLAVLLLLSGLAIGVGAFWDEIWHRQYGIPFGRDLFWRPHMLMYAGLAGVIATAGTVLRLALRRSGRLRERLAAEPAHVPLLLLGGFLLYSLPADPLWHTVYGGDISAWSLPHLLLALNFSAITVVALALFAGASGPAPDWRGAAARAGRALFVVAAAALSLNMLLQIFTTEWDNLRFVPVQPQGAFFERPEWLLPALLAAIAVSVGLVANRVAARPGAATLSGLAALAFRWGMLRLFDFGEMSVDMWLLVLPPLLAVDLAAWLLARRRPPIWWQAGLAGAAGAVIGTLLLLPRLLIYPRVDATTLPPMLLATLLISLGAAWFGGRLGVWLLTAFAATPPRAARTAGRRWLLPSVGGATLIAVAWFIVSASPPA